MLRNDEIRMYHMLDAAEEAIGFSKGRVFEELFTDRQLVLSLTKDIEIIGEAAYQVSEETRKEYPDVPWEDIIGMRHRLVHAYFDINLEMVIGVRPTLLTRCFDFFFSLTASSRRNQQT